MPTEDQLRTAASVKPSLRTDEQNRWLASGSLSQAVRNNMAKAAEKERIHGAN